MINFLFWSSGHGLVVMSLVPELLSEEERKLVVSHLTNLVLNDEDNSVR